MTQRCSEDRLTIEKPPRAPDPLDPSDPGDPGGRREESLSEVVNRALSGTWLEVSRTTSTVDVQGVSIERIETVTFRIPTGAEVTLSFSN